MSGSWPGSAGNHLDFNGGSIGAAGTGAHSIAVLWQSSAAGSTNTGLVNLLNGSTQVRDIIVDGGAVFGAGDFSSGFPGAGVTNSTWYVTGISKAAGSNTYRCHHGPWTGTGTALAHGVAAGAATHGDGSAINVIQVGNGDDPGQGLIAVVAIWASVVADAGFDALNAASLSAWAAQTPGALITLDQWNGTSGAADVLGTATFTAETGTVSTGADPPGFSFALSTPSVGVAEQWLPQPLLFELAGRNAAMWQNAAPTGTTQTIDATVPVTATVAAVATEVANAAATVPVTATVVANATEVANATATVATTATITAALSVVTGAKTIDATVPVTATITATAQEVANATATVPISATVAATAQEIANAAAAVATTATITAAAAATHPIDATRPTTATIAATATEVANAQATVPVTATITAALSVGATPVTIAATVPVTATITAAATEVANATATRPTTATITAAVTVVHPVDVTRLTTVTIAATATEVARAQAAVATAATILASLSVGKIGAGRMASSTSVAGSASATKGGTASGTGSAGGTSRSGVVRFGSSTKSGGPVSDA